MTRSLLEVRAEWEQDLKIIAEVPVFVKNSNLSEPNELDKLIVILKNRDGLYYIHRYFELSRFDGSSFNVSVDSRLTDAKDVMKFIEEEYPEGLKTNII